ncbi:MULTISPECIES: GspE/PulE family protein [unclassified Helicobacter]|uniref:GspE/PulE family protein n=1 Tax=unclassified Helicobacter TaxID=2593540 RepID=UPI000CF18E60|nr:MULTISPECIES: GspE/PulE family protein [unclassified Helicobacter]
MKNLRIYRDNIKILGAKICKDLGILLVIDESNQVCLGVVDKKTKNKDELDSIYSISIAKNFPLVDLDKGFFYYHLKFIDFQERQKEIQDNIEKLFNFILKEAIRVEASDIHLENFDQNAWLRFRIDGELQEVCEIEKEIFNSLCLKIKLESKLDITEIKQAQDGRYSIELNSIKYDFRISCIPTYEGESIVLRILHKQKQQVNLNWLNLSDNHLNLIQSNLTKSHGIILITGPTGSGKSTTLYAILESFKNSRKKIITIEDPVEYKIPYATQIQVIAESDFSFAQALSAILRQDPDIIMVGEIRDIKTLELAFRASLTGHLVFATLHTNDAKSTFERLIDMGMNKHSILSSLLMIVSQKLLKKPCSNCQEKRDEGYQSMGCKACNYQGILGREVVTEVLVLDKEVKKAIKEDRLEEYLDSNAFETLYCNALRKQKEGRVVIDTWMSE